MKDSDAFISDILSETTLTKIHSEQFMKDLADGINWLIDHQFEKLIYLLYRVDVSEDKIRNVLALHTNSYSGEEIAKLIIQRMAAKIETRKSQQFGYGESEEERL